MNERDKPGVTHTAHDSTRMLASGTVIAERYRIVALCGVGGMGMVYRARDTHLDIDVALKVMRPEWLAEQQMLERFRRELVLARQVSHRNVVRIHDIGSDGELHFLTMDFIDGRPLSDLLAAEGALPVVRAVKIAQQLAEALAAAHDEDVVHRDLKPANIIVTDDDRAFITDFGIARSTVATGMTQIGHVLGTPEYLSPEQASGDEVDGRSDIYALGLVIYKMLTGDLPFAGGTYEEVIAQHTTGRARDISRSGFVVPRWLRQIIQRCLQRNRDDRYANAAHLARDLGSQSSTLFSRRHVFRAAGAVGIIAVSILGGFLATDVQLPKPLEPADNAVAAGPRHTLAILPLRRESEIDAWVTAGLVESLSAQLAESADLQLIEPGRLARTLEDLEIDPASLSPGNVRQLVDLLNIDRLITGSVVGKGDAFRIRLRLDAAGPTDEPSIALSEDVISQLDWFTAVDALGDRLRKALSAKVPTSRIRPLTASLAALENYTEGVSALRAGDSLRAAPLLENAVREDDQFVAAWIRLSESYALLGRDDDALDAARTSVARLDSNSGRLLFEARAQEAALAGQPAQAEQYLRQLLAVYPHDVETQVTLGETIGDSGRFDEAIKELLAVTRQDLNHPRAWYLLGKFSILNGDSQRAVDEYLVRALVIHNKLDNDQGRADVFNAMGIAHHQLGNLHRAGDYYRQAAEMRERIGDERGVVAALSNIARLQMIEGEYAQARTRFEEAIVRLEALGDRGGIANMHNEIGILEEELGDYDAALARYRTALQIREGLGDRRAKAESYNNVGYSYYLLGQYDNASVYAQQSLSLYREADNSDGVMLAQQTLGLLEIARGNWNVALKSLLEALAIAREVDFPHAIAVSRGNLGFVAQLQGRYRAAAQAYDEAIVMMEEYGDPRGVAEFALHRAELDLELGLVDVADEHLVRANNALSEAGNLEQSSWFNALQARKLLLKGDVDASLAAFESARDASRRSGSELAELRVAQGHAEALVVAGGTEVALDMLAALRDRADALGHTDLRLRFRLIEAHAARLAGDDARAKARITEAQTLLRDVGEYAWSWKINRLASELAGREKPAIAKQALQEFERMRGNMDEVQRAGFDALHAGDMLFAQGEDTHMSEERE